jgi:hypothetical protein
VQVDDDVLELLALGVATIVASRDEELRPEIARGWGISVSPGRSEATLCIEAPQGSTMRSNLEHNGAIAVTCSLPTSYRTIQLKGEAYDLREPTPQQLADVERHADAFAREAEQVGLPTGAGLRLVDPQLTAVAFSVRELYDQTPGPTAGSPL